MIVMICMCGRQDFFDRILNLTHAHCVPRHNSYTHKKNNPDISKHMEKQIWSRNRSRKSISGRNMYKTPPVFRCGSAYDTPGGQNHQIRLKTISLKITQPAVFISNCFVRLYYLLSEKMFCSESSDDRERFVCESGV